MRWALAICALAIGGAAYAIHGAHQAGQRSAAEAAAAVERWRAAVAASEQAARQPTAEDIARAACRTQAEMAAAVHRADAARVETACIAGWRRTGTIPRI